MCIRDRAYLELDHPRGVLGGLYHSAKSGDDRCNSFDNMKISIFGAFAMSPRHLSHQA